MVLIEKYNDEKYYLKLKDDAIEAIEDDLVYWNWKKNQTVYGRKFTSEEDETKLVLQYWFFYIYNDWGGTAKGGNQHEGDWEMIQITLDSEKQLESITFGFHHGGQTFPDDKLNNSLEDVKFSGNHPKIYIALGGHGCWNTPENHKWYQTVDVLGCLNCTDETDDKGDVLYPGTMSNSDVGTIESKSGKYAYAIEDMTNWSNEDADWIYWKGYWGTQTNKKMNGKEDYGSSGPQSPPYIDYIFTELEKWGRWYKPMIWKYSPLPTTYTVCSSSNSNIIINSKNSKYSDYCNVIGKDEECSQGCSNLITIISSKDLQFEVYSLDGEEVTLKISRYNRDTNEVNEVEFDWLEIPKNGKATLKFSPKKNPDFEIMIDNDLDNVTDRIVMPDYSTQYQR